jgi:hypothetical protein
MNPLPGYLQLKLATKKLFGRLARAQCLEFCFRNLVNVEHVTRQAGDITGISNRTNRAFADRDGFRFGITFSASFKGVLDRVKMRR